MAYGGRGVHRDCPTECRTDEDGHFQGVCPVAERTDRWEDMTVLSALDQDGKVISYISIARHTTEHKKQRVALEDVIAKMRQRLRNGHSIVCGFIRRMTRGDDSLANFSIDLERLIIAMSDAIALAAGEFVFKSATHGLIAEGRTMQSLP